MNDKEAIDVYVDGSLGIFSAAVSLTMPTLSIAALALQPTLSLHLKKLLYKLAGENKISQREYSRLDSGIDGMTETLKENSCNSSLRTDGLLQQNSDGFCEADNIFENLINSIKRDSESKKARFYGNFIGNIPYSTGLSYSNLMQYAKTVEQLTYAELCLLCSFYRYYKNKTLDFGKAELYVKRSEDADATETLAEIIKMRNLGLLVNHPPYISGEIIGKLSLSISGERLYELMRLNLVESKDAYKALGQIQKITKYLS